AEDGSRVSVRLDAFHIDRTEVTNAAWAACVARGGCLPPQPVSSATRAAYFGEPAFKTHPVVNVTQSEAAAFCALQGKRLPTAAEWEVAATLAPATQRLWRYPWGEAFAPSLVVGSDSHEDTAPVRSRSTRGDSPLGAADMAGNVAEWTATPTGAQPDQPLTLPLVETGPVLDTAPLANDPQRDTLASAYVVKGGSFLSAAAELLPAASPSEVATARANWLGFRCASTLPR
ncbi:MAG: formylglycine-generating enzyme family protein, partial [Caldilineaceae bacterium]